MSSQRNEALTPLEFDSLVVLEIGHWIAATQHPGQILEVHALLNRLHLESDKRQVLLASLERLDRRGLLFAQSLPGDNTILDYVIRGLSPEGRREFDHLVANRRAGRWGLLSGRVRWLVGSATAVVIALAAVAQISGVSLKDVVNGFGQARTDSHTSRPPTSIVPTAGAPQPTATASSNLQPTAAAALPASYTGTFAGNLDDGTFETYHLHQASVGGNAGTSVNPDREITLQYLGLDGNEYKFKVADRDAYIWLLLSVDGRSLNARDSIGRKGQFARQ
jgi:hypothetical protein